MKRINSIFALLLLLCCSVKGVGEELIDRDIIDSIVERRAVTLTLDGVVQQRVKGDLAKAKELFLEATTIDSLYTPPLYYLANIYAPQSIDSALKFAAKAYELDSLNSWYARQYALFELESGNITRALDIYEMLVKGENADIDTYRQKASAHRRNGDSPGAIEVLDSAASRFGFDPSIGIMQLEIYTSDIKDFSKSEEVANKLIKLLPDDVELRLAIASLYAVNGLDSLTLKTIEQAQSLDTLNIQPKLMLLEWYNSKGDYPSLFGVVRDIIQSEAVDADYKVGLFDSFTSDSNFYSTYYININSLALALWHTHPDSEKVLSSYTKHLIAGGALDSVVDIYQELVEKNTPPDYKHLETLIDVNFFLKRSEEVNRIIRQNIKYFPDSLNLYPKVGYSYNFDTHTDKAIEGFKWALRYTKKSPEIQSVLWSAIGDCYQMRARQEGAKSSSAKRSFAAYDKSLRIDPNNHLTLNNYAYSLTQLNPTTESISKALVMSTRANSLDENNASYIDTQGYILYLMGNYQQAKTTLQQAISLDGSNGEVLFHYGEVLMALGENFLAGVYLDRALAAGYSSSEVEAKKSELEQIKGEQR